MHFEMLSEEEKKEFLEKIARLIVEKEMEAIAITFLETIKPLSFVGSQLTFFICSPFLTMLGGELEEKGYTLIRLFEKDENVEYLLQRIEILSKEKRALKEKDRKERRINKPKILLKIFRRNSQLNA